MFTLIKRRTSPVASPRSNSQWLSRLQQQARGVRDEELVVDLANVESINSRELGILVKIHLNLRQHDCRLVLGNAHGGVLEVLELTRMNRLLELRDLATNS